MLLDKLGRADHAHFVAVLRPEVAKAKKFLQKKPLEAVRITHGPRQLALTLEKVDAKMNRTVFEDDDADTDGRRSFDSGLPPSASVASPMGQSASPGASPVSTPESVKPSIASLPPSTLLPDSPPAEILSYAQATTQQYNNV
jgi:hypothetical protein